MEGVLKGFKELQEVSGEVSGSFRKFQEVSGSFKEFQEVSRSLRSWRELKKVKMS